MDDAMREIEGLGAKVYSGATLGDDRQYHREVQDGVDGADG